MQTSYMNTTTVFAAVHIYILESSAALRAALIHAMPCLQPSIVVVTAYLQTNTLRNSIQASRANTQRCSRNSA